MPKVPGRDLGEYPLAMFKEGGRGASVRAVAVGENRAVGAYVAKQLEDSANGTKVLIEVVP